ncbi:MAG: hypothetical protein EXS31_09705 [Pedosphaera sp.]|nr:hypothetical protein [Pedosphaera sp.]
MSAPSNFLPPFPAYFEPETGKYWIQDSSGRWIKIDLTSLRLHLKKAGFSTNRRDDDPLSSIDAEILRIQVEANLAYAGPLAGFRAGVHLICENRVLVTTSPTLIEPKSGEWLVLSQFLLNLLTSEGVDQRPYFFGWCKVAFEALRLGIRRPGQALAFAGPRGCGKSLLQNFITILFGGRVAKPYRYMIGSTNFNGELLGTEHLMIEDESASTDMRSRRHFGSRIKDVTVNQVQSCHPKNRQAISLTPFWRLTISVNDESENLMVLPPIDESLEDKIILFKAYKLPLPLPTGTDAERERFWETLIGELPAFLHFLVNYQIPEELKSERFGVTHFHHPELLRELGLLSPENRLLALIDGEISFRQENCVSFNEDSGSNEPRTWVGTAEKLEGRLCAHDSTNSHQARLLLSWTNACGTYLGRLARSRPDRVSERRTNSARLWEIQPPCPGGTSRAPGDESVTP